jgi:hypothetical protein
MFRELDVFWQQASGGAGCCRAGKMAAKEKRGRDLPAALHI